jgi:hypothetical protein
MEERERERRNDEEFLILGFFLTYPQFLWITLWLT